MWNCMYIYIYGDVSFVGTHKFPTQKCQDLSITFWLGSVKECKDTSI